MSRKIVESTRRRSISSGSTNIRGSELRTQTKSDSTIWREYATNDGYLYYYSEETKQTVWERPTNGKIIPYISPVNKKFNLDQAKLTLSGKQ